VCVCVRARAGPRACLRASVWVLTSVGMCMCARACSLAFPTYNAYAPYCDVICGLWLHRIFRHYLINGTIFGKKLLNIKCVMIFSTTFFQNISNSKKNLARYCRKCENGLHVKYPLFLSDFNETWILSTYFLKKKSLNIKLYKNLPSGSRVVPCGWADWHDEANSRISQLCERA
jgi:hypothetical protein